MSGSRPKYPSASSQLRTSLVSLAPSAARPWLTMTANVLHDPWAMFKCHDSWIINQVRIRRVDENLANRLARNHGDITNVYLEMRQARNLPINTGSPPEMTSWSGIWLVDRFWLAKFDSEQNACYCQPGPSLRSEPVKVLAWEDDINKHVNKPANKNLKQVKINQSINQKYITE